MQARVAAGVRVPAHSRRAAERPRSQERAGRAAAAHGASGGGRMEPRSAAAECVESPKAGDSHSQCA